jgi:Tfp pilus assembly protein PilX
MTTSPRRYPARRDAGSTFVEILVSVVLLGTVVVAVLTAARATIIASAIDRDHSNAHAWLQGATDLIYQSPRLDCGTPTDNAATAAAVKNAILAGYEGIAQAVSNPEAWPANSIEVTDVAYWNGTSYQTICYDDVGLNLQLLTIQVADPNGTIIEQVEVVKGA